jgi:hypothetical protein
MFFVDPVAAFANIRAALDEGGRCVFVCWRPLVHNPWIAVPLEAVLRHVDRPDPGDPDAPGPFSLAEPDRIRSILGAAGYVDLTVEPVSEPLWIGTDVADAMTFFGSTGIARAPRSRTT